MMYIRSEGGQVRNGFNFYPLSDQSSFGFIFRFKRHAWWFRYSKIAKKFIVKRQSLNKETNEKT